MIASEVQIKQAAKLYQCRDCAKFLFGDDYHQKIEPYQQVIKSLAAAEELEIIPAATRICNTGNNKENGMLQMIILAAAVEIIEPSN
jgi:hypothetical protein